RHERKRERGLFSTKDGPILGRAALDIAIPILERGEAFLDEQGYRNEAKRTLPELTLTEPTRRLIDKIALAGRLLKMPGDKNKYKLAKLLVAENRSPDLDNAKRQINDALAAVRRVQAAENVILSVGISEDADYRVIGFRDKVRMTYSAKPI